jgi:site-specific DNA-methyltransferase (adenine-specific)
MTDIRPEIASRLFNEDCISGMARIPDKSIDMVLADPPYGTTECAWDIPLPLPEMWAQLKRVCKPRAAILLFAQCPFSIILGASNLKMLKHEWVWLKNRSTGFLNSRKMPMKASENILVFYSDLPKYNPQFLDGEPYHSTRNGPSRCYGDYKVSHETYNDGFRWPVNTIKFPVIMHPEHPTQKPIDLCEYLIKTYTDPGETVLDITAGSGTTAVAAVNLDRDWVAFEKESDYYHIAARRIGEAMDQKERSLFFTGFPEQKFQLEA